MKKLLPAVGLLAGIFLLVGCKKKDADVIPSGDHTFTPAAVPTLYGFLQPNVNTLLLHTGDHATISVKVYNADGSLLSSAPSVQWLSTNITSATVSSGAVSAVGVGESQIEISDGIHATGFVKVLVLPDSVPFPSGPVNIVFSAPQAGCITGTPTALPSYTVTDNSGAVLSVQPTFEIAEAASGITFSGNTISATSKGMFHLQAKYNGILLSGGLLIAAHAPITSGYDTLTDFYVTGNFPFTFYQYGAISKPIKIMAAQSIYEVTPNTVHLLGGYFETTPDAITIHQPEVVTESAGLLKAVYAGGANLTLSWRGATRHCHTIVMNDMTGSWGGTANGVEYNFCVDPPKVPIRYTDNLDFGFSGDDDGAKDLMGGVFSSSQSVTAKVGGVICPAYYDCRMVPPAGPIPSATLLGDGLYYQRLGNWSVLQLLTNSNKTKFDIYNNNLVLTKGTGNCNGGGNCDNTGTGTVNFNGANYNLFAFCSASGGTNYGLVVNDNCLSTTSQDSVSTTMSFLLTGVQSGVTYNIPNMFTSTTYNPETFAIITGSNSANPIEYFFSGGTYTVSGHTVTINGTVQGYSGFNGALPIASGPVKSISATITTSGW